ARVQEYTVRGAQVRKQVQIEAERLQRQARFSLRAPIDGVVWRRPVPAGGTVTRQTDVLQLLDPADIFVDAVGHEKYIGTIRPGDPAVIRLVGSSAEAAGTVRDVLGQVALGDDRSLAAESPKPGRHEIHVIVTFDGGPPSADHFHPYHLGQPAEVRFPDGGSP